MRAKVCQTLGVKTMDRPKVVTDEHLEYLDQLRDIGAVNMFGAGVYLVKEFHNISKDDAAVILKYWMQTFNRRNNNESK